MKHLKLFFALFAMLALGVGNAWAETATITFKNQSSGTSDGSTAYTTSNFVSSGIASSDAAFGTITCSATSKCYSGKTGMGLKAGGSSAAGSFTITFSTPLVNVSKVTLNAAAYRSDKSVDITVKNGSTQLSKITSITNTTLYDIDIADLNIASFNTLTIESTKYCYIKSITITYNPSAGGETPDPTPVTVTLDKTELSLQAGATETLTATVTGSTESVTWSSSAIGVATVDNNGKVTAVAAGDATITAAIGEVKATCAVKVTAATTPEEPGAGGEASTVTFTYADLKGQGTSGSGADFTGATKENIHMGGKGRGNTSYVQIYSNNYLTFTPTNATITKIVLTATSGYIKTWSASEGTIEVSGDKATWTGSSTSTVTLTNTASAQARITQMDVTYTASGSDEPEAEIVKTLKSIAVSDMTTIYEQGSEFSFDGKCTATYSVTIDGAAQADQTAKVEPTSVTTPDMNRLGTQTVTVTYTEGEVTKTADYTITIEEAPTYNFRKIEKFNEWTSSYAEHVVTYSDAEVTFASACKQSGTITDQPVTKGGDVSLVLTDGMNIATVKWVCTQWGTKAQTITLHYSKDGGHVYTSTEITSSDFTISSDNLPAGTNAVKITFNSTSNQVGIKSCTITKVEAAAITQVPAPLFSLTSGAYDGAQSVELTCTMADATIHYTTDGSTPTTTSPVYSTAIQVTESMTIKAYAVKEGLEDSPVVEAKYEISAPADVVLDFTTNDTWNFPTEKTVTATDYSNGDYTVTVAGSEGQGFMFDDTNKNLMIGKEGSYIMLPIFNKPIVKIVCEGVSSGSGSVTFNVFVDDEAVSTAVTSCKVDQTFLIAEDKQVANVAHVIKVTNAQNVRFSKIKIYLGEAPAVERPVIGGEEELVAPTEVSITCATSGAKIYYTTDGNTPTTSSTEYTAPFELSTTTTVKAIAYADGQASAVATKTFTFIETITCVKAAEIALAQSDNNVQTEKKYRIVAYVTETLSGVSSNQQSFKVVDNIGEESVFQSYYCNVPEAMAAGMKVEMIGKLSKYNTTAQMKNGDVTILEKPVAAPKILGAEAFETSTEVTITAEEGMQIYYTLDGTTPTTGSTQYTAAFTVSATTTVKAIAYNSATEKSSAVAEKTFTKTTISTKTIAEFIASQGGACYLEGIVSNIQNTQYGNFDLTDETGTIYIYGCLNANGESKKFAELGVKEGDLLKVQANVYEFYNEKHEAKNVVYVSHVSNSEEPEAPELPTTAGNATFVFNTAEGLADLGIAYPTTEDGTGKKTDIENNTTVISNGVGLTMTGGNTTATRIWLTASEVLDLRVYKGATLTFAVADGYEITKVVFDGSALTNLAVGGIAIDGTAWEGSQKTVTFENVNATVKINTIAVTVAYTRNVTNKYGSICLPYASASTSGAYFYEVVGKGTENGKDAVYLASVSTLKAGVPYIFEKTANTIKVVYSSEKEDTPQNANGLIGNFTNEYVVPANNYILHNNAFIPADGTTNKVNAYRAYLDLSAVEGGKPNQMPGRRYIGMGVQGENGTTGLDNIVAPEGQLIKTIENGQLIIIRNGEKYNVQGVRL